MENLLGITNAKTKLKKKDLWIKK